MKLDEITKEVQKGAPSASTSTDGNGLICPPGRDVGPDEAIFETR